MKDLEKTIGNLDLNKDGKISLSEFEKAAGSKNSAAAKKSKKGDGAKSSPKKSGKKKP